MDPGFHCKYINSMYDHKYNNLAQSQVFENTLEGHKSVTSWSNLIIIGIGQYPVFEFSKALVTEGSLS